MSSPSAVDKTLMVLDAVLEHSRFTDVVNATRLAAGAALGYRERT